MVPASAVPAGAHRTGEGQQAASPALRATGGPAFELSPFLPFWGGCNIPGGAIVALAPSWGLGTCLCLQQVLPASDVERRPPGCACCAVAG